MHITLETDYAVRILLFLMKENQRVDAKKISEGTDVTLRFALKILRKLVAAGFVTSYKGIKGGYEYAKLSPKDLSLYDVIEAIEGNCFISRCLDQRIGCNHGKIKICKVRRAFAQISKHLKSDLQKVTFDMLL